MVIANANKTFLVVNAAVLLLATGVAAWFMQWQWLLVPIVALAAFGLLQKPVLLFYLLMAAIPWSVEYNFPSGLGTDLPDEPLMLLTALTLVIQLCFQHRTILERQRWHPLLILLLLQFVWIIITVINSTHFVLSAKYLLAKTWYLLAFVATPLLLWKEEKVFLRSILILLLSMVAVTALSLFRHALLNFSFSTINDAVAPFFRNHVNYSALLVFTIPVQWMLLKNSKHKKLRWFWLITLAITLPALYFSFARGAWVALVVGLIAFFLLKKRWLFTGFLAGILLVTALFFWLRQDNRYVAYAHNYQTTIFHQDFREHLAATYQLKDMSTAERFHRWIAGVRMVEDYWQTGSGPTTFYQHYKSYTVPAFKTWVSKNEEQSTVHNYFLLLLVEQGAVGLLLFLLLLEMLFWYAQKIYHRTTDPIWKRTVATIAIILSMQCTLNFLSDLIETDKVGSIFYLCIAALIIADRKTRVENK